VLILYFKKAITCVAYRRGVLLVGTVPQSKWFVPYWVLLRFASSRLQVTWVERQMRQCKQIY